GLAITSNLVKIMGGRVWVESPWQDQTANRVVTGSAFHFTANFQAMVIPSTSSDRAVSLKGVPILVADDHAPSRLILSEILRGWGMRPTCVEDGAAALRAYTDAAAQGTPFPLVALDFQMPGLDGCEAAEHIRSIPSPAYPKIFLLTSATDRSEETAYGIQTKIDARLLKPVKQSELLITILSALNLPDVKPPNPEERNLEATRYIRPLRVLLAEDNLVNRTVASRLLQKRDHTVLTAGDGREALAVLARESIDLVLMDVQMPGMDGLEAVSILRQREVVIGGHIPVVAMTANAMEGD